MHRIGRDGEEDWSAPATPEMRLNQKEAMHRNAYMSTSIKDTDNAKVSEKLSVS